MEPKKKTNLIIGLVVVAAIAIVAGLLLSGNGPEPQVQGNKVPSNSNVIANKDAPLAEGKFELKISADGFTPQEFRMKKLQQLVITIVNKEEDFHNTLKFEDALLPFEAIIPSGGVQSFTIVAPEKTGKYTFFTDVGTVRYGTLVVE